MIMMDLHVPTVIADCVVCHSLNYCITQQQNPCLLTGAWFVVRMVMGHITNGAGEETMISGMRNLTVMPFLAHNSIL